MIHYIIEAALAIWIFFLYLKIGFAFKALEANQEFNKSVLELVEAHDKSVETVQAALTGVLTREAKRMGMKL